MSSDRDNNCSRLALPLVLDDLNSECILLARLVSIETHPVLVCYCQERPVRVAVGGNAASLLRTAPDIGEVGICSVFRVIRR